MLLFIRLEGIQVLFPSTYACQELDVECRRSLIADDGIQDTLKSDRGSALLGIYKVRTFIGKDKTKTVEENLSLFETVWRPIAELAKEKKIWVCIENCPMSFTPDEWPGGLNLASSPHIWRKMFSTFDSPYFGLSYDPSHLSFQGMDYIKPIYAFRDKIRHVHIKDIRIFRDKLDEYGSVTAPLDYMTPKLPGLGGIDWSEFTSALYDIDPLRHRLYRSRLCGSRRQGLREHA